MKKLILFLLLAAIITFSFPHTTPLDAGTGNLVANSDFSSGLSGWDVWGNVSVINNAAAVYSNIGTNSGIHQKISTSEKNLIFTVDINPRYGTNSGVQIAFNIYKNGAQLGQAFGYFNSLPAVKWTTVSFKVEDFWKQNTQAKYADFDQIEIFAETYNGCIAQFDNFKLEAAPKPGTTLEVTKDATASEEGYITWSIEKSADKDSIDLYVGQSASATYTVTATPIYHATGITVSGSINISNTGSPGEGASIAYVKDKVEYRIGSGPWQEISTQDISGPFTLSLGDNTSIPYSISFTPIEGASYRNTALVGLNNCALSGGGVGFYEFSHTLDFSVSGGHITSDAFADVSDSLKGYLGEAWVGDPGTYVYTYNINIGPYSSPGDYTVDNKATVTGKDSQAKDTASDKVTVHVKGKGTITVHKELKAPDGKSEPLIPDKHLFKITLQKSTSSGWEDVGSGTIRDGDSWVFSVELGTKYRVLEEKDEDYVQIGDSGVVSLDKNGQNVDIILKNKQKPALVKVYIDVIGINGAKTAEDQLFWLKLKGGYPTIYQPVNEGFYTFFVVWPGKYSTRFISQNPGFGQPGDSGGPLIIVSNGKYKINVQGVNKNLVYGPKIVFSSDRDGNEEIYLMNVNGTGQTRLTNNPADDLDPSFSPDGKKITFTSERDGKSEIYIMNSDGTGQTRLTNNTASDYLPCFSPDGKKIAFTSERDGKSEIYIMNSDGTGQIRLTNNSADDWVPSFSPDGTKIVFTSNRDGKSEIYIMNSNGAGQIRLTNNFAHDDYPSFSPDGTKIVFTSNRDGNLELYIMNADGSGQSNLTNTFTDENLPSFSPDGTQIAFSTVRNNNYEIFTMNSDGSGQVNLTNNAAMDNYPSF